MSDLKEIEKLSVFTAGSKLISHIPQFAGIIAGATALSYIIGWREASTYYTTLGAPWAASLLPSSLIMQTSVEMISILILTCFLSFHMYSSKQIGSKGLTRLLLFSLALAGTAFAVSLFGGQRFSSTIINSSATIAAQLWAVYAGFALTDLIVRLAEKGLQWDANHLWLAYLVVFIGCWTAPSHLGNARAVVDAEPATSSLATVLTADSPHGPRWKLVTAFDGYVLLMQPATESLPRRFKLAKNEELLFVHAAPKKK